MGSDKVNPGRKALGGNLNSCLDATGVRDDGPRGKAGTDGAKGFRHLVDRGGDDNDVGTLDGLDGVIEDFGDRITL